MTLPNSIWVPRYSSSKSIGWFKLQISQCNPIGFTTCISLNFHTLLISIAPISELKKSWKELRSTPVANSYVLKWFLASERCLEASGKSSVKNSFFFIINENIRTPARDRLCVVNRQKVRSLCIKNPNISTKKITFLISFPQEVSSHRLDGFIVQYGWFCVGLHHSTPPNSIWARRYSSSKSIGWFKFQISQCNPIGSITWIALN